MTVLLRIGTKVRTIDRWAGVHGRPPEKPEAIGIIRDHFRPYGRQSKDRTPPYYVTFETGETAWYDASEVEPIRGLRASRKSSIHHATKKRNPAQLDREIAEALGKPKDEVIATRKTYDGKNISLWSDGSLTWGRLGTVIKGSPHARTTAQIQEARDAGWLVMGEVEVYDADEVPRLIEVARKVAKRGGRPGDVRAEFAKQTPIKPHWTVIETDRNGKPLVRSWILPRLTHPGLAVWDEIRGSGGRGRYQVMREVARGSGTYEPTGFQFNDLDKLTQYLRGTSQLGR